MKKIKILLLLLTVAVGGFYSCTDNNPVENEVVTTKSISLRTTLNEIRKNNNIQGKNAVTTQDAFCFNFVFPLTLAYSDGTVITVASYDGLLDVLSNETSTLYIEGIEFPFQVQQGGAVITINDEAAFFALIDDCNFYTLNDIAFDFTCYSIVFPISVVNASGETVVINSQTELVELVSSPAGTVSYQLDIVFPISVIQNDQTIVINNLYEFFDLNNDCSSSSCICPADYAPVCVQTATGVVEYSNMCHAQCDGYTTADVVSCNPVITVNFGTGLGSCFNVVYPVQVMDSGALVTVNSDGDLLQYYFPAQSSIPALVYPVSVDFPILALPAPLVFQNQAEFEAAIANLCN